MTMSRKLRSKTVPIPVMSATDGQTERDTRWMIDKHVPVSLIFAIAVQTAGVFWWAAGVNNRVEALEIAARALPSQNERLIKLEERLDVIRSAIVDIKDLLRIATAPTRTTRPPSRQND